METLDKKNGFTRDKISDLILKYAVSPIEDSVQVEEEETKKPEIADTEKYIVSPRAYISETTQISI